MANLLGLNRINIEIPDAGVLRIVSGATVTVYETMADGTSPVTSDGSVSGGAVKSVLYADRYKSVTKTNPMVADAQGLVEFYVDSPEVHIKVVTPNGLTYGIQWYSVSLLDILKLESYGAVGDGVADDTLAIMAAHNALPATGGKITLEQNKKYRFTSQLLFTKKIHIEGAVGSDSDTIPSNCELVKASTLNATGIVLAASGSQLRNLSVRGEVGNGGDGVQVKARDCILRDVAVVKMGGNGIRLGHSDDTNCNVNQFSNVCCRGNSGHGFYLHSDDSSVNINDNVNTFIGCEGMFNGGDGLRIGNSINNVFINWHAESNTGFGIFFDLRAQKNTFIGMFMEGNTGGGVKINDALSVDNFFIGGQNNHPSNNFVDIAGSRTLILNTPPYLGAFSGMHGLGEVLTTGPGGQSPNLSGSNQQYFSLWDAAGERIRMGWTAIAPVTGLGMAQVLADANTLYLASRDVSSGKVKIMAQTGLANYILLDPQNSKVEITTGLVLTGLNGGAIQLPEITAPGNGPANTARLFAEDNGAGKTRLSVRFPSGAVVPIPGAIEP